jgi:hypothetical protein
MLHPLTTAELVRQRLIRQLQPRARADPERGRPVPTARTVAAHVRALVARAT